MDKVKEWDNFGAPIDLNFKQHSGTYNTKCGGSVTVILTIFMTWILYTNLIWMFYYKADLITTYESATNYTQLGAINLREMGNLPFYLIEHNRKPLPVTELDTLFSYADFEFVDVLKTDSKPMMARQCIEKDFNNNDATL